MAINFKGNIPEFQTESSSGADLTCIENFVLAPGESKLVSTGLFLDIADYSIPGVGGKKNFFFAFGSIVIFDIQIRPRSGLAAKHSITVVNTPGTIDADYRDEIKVILINHGKEPVEFKSGDRIAQLVVGLAVRPAQFSVKNVKRDGGFGSSGR